MHQIKISTQIQSSNQGLSKVIRMRLQKFHHLHNRANNLPYHKKIINLLPSESTFEHNDKSNHPLIYKPSSNHTTTISTSNN